MEMIEAISDTNIGGAGVLLLTRLENNRKMREKTLVVLPGGSALAPRLKMLGVAVAELDCCADRSFELAAVFKYARLIKVERPAAVNCHGCLSFRIAAFFCGVPVRIYTRHCTFPPARWQRIRFLRFLVGRAQMLLSNGIIAVADAARDDLMAMGVPSDRVRVIVNGVSGIRRLDNKKRLAVRRELSVPREAFVVGIFARLEEYKGHTDLINAAKILLRKSDKYRFLIVGDGSRKDELIHLCREAGIYEYFIFTGFASDVTPYMNITDLNVNCSHGTETSSLALSEGMSLGLPSVASDFGGNCYMVRNGENGLIYPALDAEKLAYCIERIANDGELSRTFSQNAYARFKSELNAKKMTEETYNYYTFLRSVRASAPSERLQNN